MKFDLVRPCAHCPFKTDPRFYLSNGRASEITSCLVDQDGYFPCHETLIYGDTDTPEIPDNAQHCAGAMILLEKIESPNQYMRVAERLGIYDRARLDMNAPVYNTFEEFISTNYGK